MPVVPSKRAYDTARFSTVRPTADSFGASQARATQGLGSTINRAGNQALDIAIKNEQDDNARDLKNRESDYLRRKNEYLYGDQGIYNQKGNNAVDNEAAAVEGLDKIRKETLGGTPRARVKEQLEFLTDRDLIAENKRMARFINEQRDVASIETSSARISEYMEAAAVDPTQVKVASDVIFNEVVSMGQKMGWSPEVIEQRMLDQSSQLHAGVLDNLVSKDPAAAKAYLAKAKGQMTNKTYLKYHAAATTISTLGDAQAASDRIMSNTNLDDEDLLAQARAVKDPDVREKTVSLVRGRIAERDRFESNDRKAVYRDAAEQILTGQATLDQWAADNPDGLVTVAADPAKWAALERAEIRRLEGERFSPVTDGKTYNSILAMDPDEIVSIDANDEQYLGKLTKTEFGRLQTLVKSKQDQIDRVSGSTKHNNVALKTLSRIRPEFSWRGDKVVGTDEEIRQQNMILSSIQVAVQEEYLSRGVEPTATEVEDIVVRQADSIGDQFSVMNPFTWFGNDFDAQQWKDMTPEERADTDLAYDDLSSLAQENIDKELSGVGLDPLSISSDTKAEVARMYFLEDKKGLRQWLREQLEAADE